MSSSLSSSSASTSPRGRRTTRNDARQGPDRAPAQGASAPREDDIAVHILTLVISSLVSFFYPVAHFLVQSSKQEFQGDEAHRVARLLSAIAWVGSHVSLHVSNEWDFNKVRALSAACATGATNLTRSGAHRDVFLGGEALTKLCFERPRAQPDRRSEEIYMIFSNLIMAMIHAIKCPNADIHLAEACLKAVEAQLETTAMEPHTLVMIKFVIAEMRKRLHGLPSSSSRDSDISSGPRPPPGGSGGGGGSQPPQPPGGGSGGDNGNAPADNANANADNTNAPADDANANAPAENANAGVDADRDQLQEMTLDTSNGLKKVIFSSVIFYFLFFFWLLFFPYFYLIFFCRVSVS